MALLDVADQELFEGFIQWRKDATSGISSKLKAFTHLVLFGRFGDKDVHSISMVCDKYECKNCKMYEASRCHQYVKSAYAGKPGTMREIMNSNHARSDDEFYKRSIKRNLSSYDITELILIVGSYRYELFQEEMWSRAIRSAEHHNRLNKDDEIPVFKNKDPKYYSLEYIRENDFWSMYKETQLEGDLLCSILSDF